ncbi:hypothetical protein BDZ94DRAFT_1355150 [Collybia nuda]|uniref:Uncharacterized protein n=1 Tax=Collybia nuda TaxID=64659 RepID=A0A9P5XQK1_9AGAR|nr:hypothetical protein BDZ94DRAFT_1355150 [Collybia nuda]
MPSTARISPALAKIQQTLPSHAPILTSGRITPNILEEFETACLRFFKHKKIEEEDKVSMVIYNLLSPGMVSWVKVKSAHLCSLSWAEFMAEFKHKWLPRGWEHEITNKVIAFQRPLESFGDRQNKVRANNNLIFGLHEHVDEDHLCQHLYSHLHNKLQLQYIANDKKGELMDIEDIDEWIDKVCQLNEGFMREKQRLNHMWMEAVAGKSLGPGAALQNKTNAMSNDRSACTNTKASSSTPIYVGKLTDNKRCIIAAHKGCNKCRKLYVKDHFPCSLPILLKSEYVPLTDEITEAAKRAYMKSAKKPNTKPAYIAAVFPESSDEEDTADKEEPEMGSEEYNEYVTKPFHSLPRHFWWKCCISAPNTCAPDPIVAFIDNGASPALISAEKADYYGLELIKLKKPFPISNTFTTHGDDGISSLTHYIKLFVQSPNAQWKARFVHALVCPGLHTNLILGLDFLQCNKIVVDTDLRTVIAKETNFDLMNPPNLKLARIPIKISHHQRRKDELRALNLGRAETTVKRRAVHAKLSSLFASSPACFNLDTNIVPEPCYIGMIRECIVRLAAQSKLLKLDAKYK